ncbi:predicted protein [Coccidioides posadasii str. Silveira]|uniref:Predicted protein n=1 Tax=Coccidioides posadasii (strain RMSCC 757 / Silveira) TaxID=443226 RepID=E9DE00_COCPS|nr:predicted protein [Coccidioides posadasii str. Silveira]
MQPGRQRPSHPGAWHLILEGYSRYPRSLGGTFRLWVGPAEDYHDPESGWAPPCSHAKGFKNSLSGQSHGLALAQLVSI